MQRTKKRKITENVKSIADSESNVFETGDDISEPHSKRPTRQVAKKKPVVDISENSAESDEAGEKPTRKATKKIVNEENEAADVEKPTGRKGLKRDVAEKEETKKKKPAQKNAKKGSKKLVVPTTDDSAESSSEPEKAAVSTDDKADSQTDLADKGKKMHRNAKVEASAEDSPEAPEPTSKVGKPSRKKTKNNAAPTNDEIAESFSKPTVKDVKFKKNVISSDDKVDSQSDSTEKTKKTRRNAKVEDSSPEAPEPIAMTGKSSGKKEKNNATVSDQKVQPENVEKPNRRNAKKQFVSEQNSRHKFDENAASVTDEPEPVAKATRKNAKNDAVAYKKAESQSEKRPTRRIARK